MFINLSIHRRISSTTALAVRRRRPPLSKGSITDQTITEAQQVALLSPKNQSHYVERASSMMGTSIGGGESTDLQAYTSPITPEVLAVIAQTLIERINELDGKDCYRMIMGLGSLGLLSPPSLTLLTNRLNKSIRDLRLEEVVDIAKQIVRSGLVDYGVPLFVLVSRTIAMKLSLTTGKDLSRLITAFADAGITDVAFFDRLGIHLSGVIHTLSIGILIEALMGFARLHMRHDLLLLKASDVLASKIGQLDAQQLCEVAFIYGRFEQVHPTLHEALERQMGKVFVITAVPPHGRSQLPIASICDLTISIAILDLQWIGQKAYLEYMLNNNVDWDDIPMPGRLCASMARLKATPPLLAFRRASSGSSTEVCDWLAACGDIAERGGYDQLNDDFKNIIMVTANRMISQLISIQTSLTIRDVAVVLRAIRLLPPSLSSQCNDIITSLEVRYSDLCSSLDKGSIPPRIAVSVMYSRLLLNRHIAQDEVQLLLDELNSVPIDLRDDDPQQLAIIMYMHGLNEVTNYHPTLRYSPHSHDILLALGGPTIDGQRRAGCIEGPFLVDVIDTTLDPPTIYICLNDIDFAMDGDLSNYTKVRLEALRTKGRWARVIPISSRNWRMASNKEAFLHHATIKGEGWTNTTTTTSTQLLNKPIAVESSCVSDDYDATRFS